VLISDVLLVCRLIVPGEEDIAVDDSVRRVPVLSVIISVIFVEEPMEV